jgi:hypothetical protein
LHDFPFRTAAVLEAPPVAAAPDSGDASTISLFPSLLSYLRVGLTGDDEISYRSEKKPQCLPRGTATLRLAYTSKHEDKYLSLFFLVVADN